MSSLSQVFNQATERYRAAKNPSRVRHIPAPKTSHHHQTLEGFLISEDGQAAARMLEEVNERIKFYATHPVNGGRPIGYYFGADGFCKDSQDVSGFTPLAPNDLLNDICGEVLTKTRKETREHEYIKTIISKLREIARKAPR